jgi:O-antigen/teichoic acid export membrane protein
MGIMAAFESVVTAYFQPRLYRDASSLDPETQSKAWGRYGEALLPSLLLTTVLIIVAAPELAHLFLGKEFQSAAAYVVWGALADATRAVAAAYSMIAHVRVQTRWLVMPNLLGAVLSLGLCLAFIPSVGASGAGLALTLSGLAGVTTMHILFFRHSGGVSLGRPIRFAGLLAISLWATTFLLRHLIDPLAWWSSLGILIPVSTLFLFFQFLCLRSHIANAAVPGEA